MASELTAEQLAELEKAWEMWYADDETTDIAVGTDLWTLLVCRIPALIAAAKRVEVAERQKRIACGVADKLGERLRASNARATAAEARVGELTKALEFYADRTTYQFDPSIDEITVFQDGGQRARTALKPQGEERT